MTTKLVRWEDEKSVLYVTGALLQKLCSCSRSRCHRRLFHVQSVHGRGRWLHVSCSGRFRNMTHCTTVTPIVLLYAYGQQLTLVLSTHGMHALVEWQRFNPPSTVIGQREPFAGNQNAPPLRGHATCGRTRLRRTFYEIPCIWYTAKCMFS